MGSIEGMKLLAEEAALTLGNPIAVIDTSYNLIASTPNPVQDDPLWNELVSTGRFSHGTVDFFNTARFIQAVSDSDVVSLLKSEKLKYDRACGKFFDSQGVQLGSVVVVACRRPLEGSDFAVILSLCERMSRENECGQAVLTEHFSTPDWFAGALDGHAARPWQMREAFGEGAHRFVMVADTFRYESTSSHLAYFADLFSSMQEGARCFVHLNNIIVLFSAESAFIDIGEQLKELQDFFARYGILAGVSASFRGDNSVGHAYRQALHALDKGSLHPCSANIFLFESFGTDWLFRLTSDPDRLLRMLNPTVLQMRDVQHRGDAGHLSLLRAYLGNAKNAELTCAQLETTPQELEDRLGALASRYEINWDDGDELSSLLISMKLLEYLSRSGQE